MVKSFQNYFGLNEDAAADLVALNQQEAAAMQKVLDAQKELDAIKLKIADVTKAKTEEEDKKKAEAAKLAAAQAPTA
jgi:hypothetical protein